MMASSSGRKRSSLLVLEQGEEEPPTQRSRLSYILLESELDALRAELEHERSLREIDHRRAQQEKARLERQVRSFSDEAQEAKSLLEEVRRENEGHIKTLRDGRQDALERLRKAQEQMKEMLSVEQKCHEQRALKEKNRLLESQIDARNEEVNSLRRQLEDVIAQKTRDLARQSPSHTPPEKPSEVGGSSPAPKAVMQELNRTRIALAESERKLRQLHRKADDWQQMAQQYVRQKETLSAAKLRVSKLELDLKEAHKELENHRADVERWEELAKELGRVFNLTTAEGPPEVSTVMRHFQKQISHTKALELDKHRLETERDISIKKTGELERKLRDADAALARAERDCRATSTQLEQTNQQVQTLRAQESIWRREADSLRSLLRTFGDMPPEQSTGARVQALELALSTARGECKVIKDERDRLIQQLQAATKGKETLQKEYDQVLDKYTKLRDALMDERSRAEKAEDRALNAESLAGKGGFSSEHTRALHLEKNPLFDAMRERYQVEIASLKKRLEEMTGEKAPLGTASCHPPSSEVDPEKLHQRLKDTFKEQIGIFREGVYLITGYKIDMFLDKSSPYFKVRSVYGEREEDVLVFNWPKGVKQPKSLDLCATDFAKALSATDSYQYLTKFNSTAGFMASTQLNLLDKCTVFSHV